MDRIIGKAALSAAAGVLVASLAFAFVPEPGLSTIPECVPLSSNGVLVYQVRIVGSGGPINASRVNLLFNTVGDSLVCWCNTNPYVPGTPHSFFANTNGAGFASFNLRGGGCIEKDLAVIPGDRNYAAEVFADFVKMGEVGTVSPDVADDSGRYTVRQLQTGVWNPGSSCASGLADAVKHTTPLSLSTYDWCSDINCDNLVSLSDATIMTPYLSQATSCPGGAGQ